jgi:hypothetical protein
MKLPSPPRAIAANLAPVQVDALKLSIWLGGVLVPWTLLAALYALATKHSF